MKKLILLILSIYTITTANEYGKIDMHGGKSDAIINKNQNFNKSNFQSLGKSLNKKEEKKIEVKMDATFRIESKKTTSK